MGTHCGSNQKIPDDMSSVAPTVPGMSPDPADLLDAAGMANGKLMATRLVLWEAIDRLDDAERTEMRDAFTAMIEQIGTAWPSPLTVQQAEIIDELELITHQMRYHLTPSDEHGPPSGDYAVVCMKCDTFPILDGQPCPTCHTSQFLSVLRI